MAIKVSQGFERTGAEPIDKVFVLTKSEMKEIDDGQMPDKYFAVCKDDGNFYLYGKNNTVDETTGKFRKLEGGGGGGGTSNYADLDNLPQVNGITLLNNKTSSDLKLQHEMDEITNQEIDKIIFGE